MILAGVLSASLASCVVKNKGDGDGTGSGEPYISNQTTTENNGGVTPINPTTDPKKLNYTTVSETVYVIANNATMTPDADGAQSVSVKFKDELKRTGTTASWSRVEKDGAIYYIAASSLTKDDLGEKTFTPCTKTMYVNVDKVNIRTYPSADDYSTPVGGGRSRNDEIKVTGENGTWSRIEYVDGGTTKKGFIKSEFLSANKTTGTDQDFLKEFTDLDSPVTMYVSVGQVAMRATPNKTGKEIEVLKEGKGVTVGARGIVDGNQWAKVSWAAEGGMVQYYYISADCLSVTPTGGSATLEQMLKAYPELKKYDETKTLYTTGKVYGRKTPTLAKGSDGKDNIIKNLEKAEKVNAMAIGKIKGQDATGAPVEITWVLAQDEKVGFYFVSFAYLTTNSDGSVAPSMSLDDLLAENQGFTRREQTVNMKVISGGTSARYRPDSSSQTVKWEAGTTVKVVAEGETDNGANKWYIVELNGSYYFVIRNQLELA